MKYEEFSWILERAKKIPHKTVANVKKIIDAIDMVHRLSNQGKKDKRSVATGLNSNSSSC